MTFADLGLTETSRQALKDLFGVTDPTSIQAKAYPPLAQGRSVALADITGSGKTLAYLLPLLTDDLLAASENRLLIIAPTAELCKQIADVADAYCTALGHPQAVTAAFGGANIRYQLEQLGKRPPIVIGTPGRILELFNRRKLNGQTIRTLVLDEVDALLGKPADIADLQKRLLRDVQLVLVSASLQDDQLAFFNRDLLRLAGDGALNTRIHHLILPCQSSRKFDQLRPLLFALQGSGTSLVFLNALDQIDRIVARLKHLGLPAAGLYSAMHKNDRQAVMQGVRKGDITILVSSDLAARGLDLPIIDQVIHLDFPNDPTTYVHRAGRTARGPEAEGASVVLVAGRDEAALRIYERELGIHFDKMFVRDGLCYLGEAPEKAEKPTPSSKSSKAKKKKTAPKPPPKKKSKKAPKHAARKKAQQKKKR